MDHSDDHDDIPLPTFSGNTMPLNVSIVNDDDVGEETTRRVGGFSMAPPSFAPTTFEYAAPPSLAPPSFGGGSTFTTVTSKTAARTSSVGNNGPWNLSDAPVLPEFHPLERSSVFVPRITPRDASERIAAVLQRRSIQAEYQGNEAECLTEDNVEFSVYIYRGKKQFGHGVIVEVQRLYGNSVGFYDDMQAILDGAQDKDSHRPSKKSKTLPLIEDDDDEEVEISSSSLNFTLKMLSSGPDAKLLGLQTLSSMADSNKMGKKTASSTADQLLTPGNEVAARVLGILSDDGEQQLTVQALIVLGNVSQSRPLPMKEVKRILLNKLESKKPQIAFLAAKCIHEEQVDASLADALYSAKRLGQEKHHDALVEIANKLLGA